MAQEVARQEISQSLLDENMILESIVWMYRLQVPTVEWQALLYVHIIILKVNPTAEVYYLTERIKSSRLVTLAS